MNGTQTAPGRNGATIKPDRISAADVRASINSKVPTHPPVKWFGRPISNLITPAFYNYGWTANQVTASRAIVGLAAILLLLGPTPWWPLAGAAGFYVCFVLDCVDGNLARLRSDVSYWGKFIDGLGDSVYVLLAPFSVGIGILMNGGSAEFLILGATIALISTTNQMVRSRLSFFREWMVGLTGPLEDSMVTKLGGLRRVQSIAASILVNGTFVAPLLLIIPSDGPHLYLLALIPAQLLPDCLWLGASMLEGHAMLRRSRRSIHAALPSNAAMDQDKRK